jgi:menaquinone-dependent protoporphyrinogen oxidase
MPILTRREFLKTTAVTLGAAAVACSGAGCAPQAVQPAATIETPSFKYGKDQPVNQRVLVTYATRAGSTVGVAAAIGETLSKRGFQVDVKPVKENPAVEGYAAIIMGSAVNGANWLPEAIDFVRNNQDALNRLPTALFCVHIMNTGSDEKSLERRRAYLKEVRPLIPPVEEAYFAGMGMDPASASGFERWIYRTFKIGPEGDCRDWNKINGWAETVQL